MREFGTPVGQNEYNQVKQLASDIYSSGEPKRAVTAGDFAMDGDPSVVVARQVDLKHEEERFRVGATEPSARPPFEWLFEITSDIGESDYFKHYLVLENEVVLAQRKVLTPIDELEFEVLMGDLKKAKNWML